ncbi:Cu(I)-responsive transcriptional regulator [Rhodobacteraceae bacterium RKSG542]|uniref:Cu(I)-responsive transcriptional regulator n=1 Tax=Pseudovibrio flavus TaxID=2529854 RepID=UPI0012BCAA88|nr:Cu(I)-responsive transcriptional regulator [Pseudovibrio flavus]MTI15971.1 Cu(I)-responsive transcriptional regulator [Pseudovibrio flavus]
MNISEASKRSGLPAKTIRYYEDIELVRPARAENGYRDYADSEIERLTFLRQARHLGFTIDQCRNLLVLFDDSDRASADVKALADKRIKEIDRKMKELKALRNTLSTLARECRADEGSDCAILEGLKKS